jgi:hypothetical protein
VAGAGLTFALILSVPSSGGTVTPDLVPTPFRLLSDGLPLAQAVNVMRSVPYFHGADTAQPTLIMLAWAALAVGVVAVAARRQPHTRPAGVQMTQTNQTTRTSRLPQRTPVLAEPRRTMGS